MEKVNINIGDCILTMVHIPGNGDLSSFYVSEIPITMQQYKALSPKDDAEWNSLVEYYEKFGIREYEEFNIATAFTVEHMIDFLNKIRQPIFYCLPSREQWLHLAENHYNRVKWCIDSKFCGVCSYEAIDWEMMRDNSYDIYCLLWVANENGKRIIKGNNFTKSEERDNIAFRLVCSEFDINSYYKLLLI